MSAAPSTNPLIDGWQSHLKFNGRTPRTLEELLVARADDEHTRRRAEIKAMAPKLAQLDAFLPALMERGIRLSRRDIAGGHWGAKALRIQSSIFEKDDKLHAALLELGFKEIERKDSFGDVQCVTLKHGRSLQVVIDVKKPAPVAVAVAETAGSVS